MTSPVQDQPTRSPTLPGTWVESIHDVPIDLISWLQPPSIKNLLDRVKSFVSKPLEVRAPLSTRSTPVSASASLHHEGAPRLSGPSRAPPTGISVVIIGAGLGGLTSALECWRKGHDVRVYERSSHIPDQGDAFVIAAPARRWLQNWPETAPDYLSQAGPTQWISIKKHTGETLFAPRPKPVPQRAETSKIGNAPPTGVFQDDVPVREFCRASFVLMVYRQVKRTGIPVIFNKRVTEYYDLETSDQAGVVFGDGSRAEGDIVIAADGMNSASQELLDETKASQLIGKSLYRAGFPAEIAWQNPLVKETFSLAENGNRIATFNLAPHSHMVVHCCGRLIAFALVHTVTGTEQEDWNASVSADEVLETMDKTGGWSEACKALVKLAPPGTIRNWPLVLRDPTPKWASSRGRVLQLGDSAHPYLPTSALGASAAMEDGITIAACLELAGKDKVRQATDVYCKLRYERVATSQKIGLLNMQKWQQMDLQETKTNPANLLPRTHNWIINHDAEKYAYENYAKVVEDLNGGARFENTNIPPGAPFEPWTVNEMMGKLKRQEQIVASGDWS